MQNEDHPYVLSQLVKKSDIDWSKIHLGMLGQQMMDEMKHISHARSIEKAIPEGIDTLQVLFQKHWKHISMDTREAILDEDKRDSELAKAFLMGKIALAQEYAAEIITRLPVERAYEVLDDKSNVKYFELLAAGDDISIKDIAEQCQQDEESVRIVFREMVQLGLADFRSDGKEWKYFMTQFAKSYYNKL